MGVEQHESPYTEETTTADNPAQSPVVIPSPAGSRQQLVQTRQATVSRAAMAEARRQAVEKRFAEAEARLDATEWESERSRNELEWVKYEQDKWKKIRFWLIEGSQRLEAV